MNWKRVRGLGAYMQPLLRVAGVSGSHTLRRHGVPSGSLLSAKLRSRCGSGKLLPMRCCNSGAEACRKRTRIAQETPLSRKLLHGKCQEMHQ